MKRLIAFIAVLLGTAATIWSAPPVPLIKLRQITALTNAEADRKIPVAFEATVTSYLKQNSTLYVQDEGAGIYVFPKTDAPLVAGDRVLIQGTTAGSFHPIVVSERITFLRHGSLPEAVPATFDDLIHFKYDCVLVKVRGVIRAADKQLYSKANGIDLKVLLDGGYFDVFVDYNTDDSLENLLDAEVEITGVAGGAFGGKMQVVGIMMVSPSPSLVRVIHRANTDPWTLPLTPMDQVITSYHVTDRTQRVRVHGVLTYYQPNRSAVLQDGKKSLWIMTQTYQPMAIGDIVDATGFPEAHNGFLTLSHGELRDSYVRAPIAPMPTTRKDLATSGHIIDLVSVEGIVVSEARGGTQDQYNLTADGQLFNAIYHHPTDNQSSLPMKQIPIGSKVRVTGICVTEDSNPFDPDVGFDILMRDFDDIIVVASPSMVNIRNLTIVVGLLLFVVFFAIARSWAVERKVRRQAARLAATEQRRSRILVDINGSRPLAEIIEEITEFVSFQLGGIPCWCQITDGARLGKFFPEAVSHRIACEEIPSRSGLPLGEILAAVDKTCKPSVAEADTLSMAAGLAALAIETRRLYSDLHRRSEFDLLTDIHNRFALEKQLDLRIGEARNKAGVLGLIYIDLDKFKPINDQYGHHVGDLYLQEVALRMKHQLRGADILARLGGDEFAALISEARNREGVEEIAYRLKRCFDQPFFIEGIRILGAASFGIAFYPEDGATRDDLLNAADTAMYTAKNKKRQEVVVVA